MSLRVLHVHSGNLYGGVETLLTTLAQHRRVSPEMEVSFALCFDGRLSETLAASGVTVHRLGRVRFSRPWSLWRARFRLEEALEGGYTHVVCHSPWSQAAFGKVIRDKGAIQVLFLHGPLRRDAWLERLAARSIPHAILTNSRFTAETVISVYPSVPVETVYLPVDLEGFSTFKRAAARRELGVAPQQVVIVQPSRMEAWKGQALHLEALAELVNVPNWTCWMVGGAQRPEEARYLESLHHQARALGIANRVQFLGQRSNVPQLLAAADIVCQPNTAPEPFGLTFIEAMASGLPVVSTALGGALELLDEHSGRLVSPSASKVASALRTLILDADLRKQMGEHGKRRAKELCDLQRQMSHLTRALRNMAASKQVQPDEAFRPFSGVR